MALPFLRHGGPRPLGAPESTPPHSAGIGLDQEGKGTQGGSEGWSEGSKEAVPPRVWSKLLRFPAPQTG